MCVWMRHMMSGVRRVDLDFGNVCLARSWCSKHCYHSDDTVNLWEMCNKCERAFIFVLWRCSCRDHMTWGQRVEAVGAGRRVIDLWTEQHMLTDSRSWWWKGHEYYELSGKGHWCRQAQSRNSTCLDPHLSVCFTFTSHFFLKLNSDVKAESRCQ